MKEIWRDIPDYEGIYQASSLGRIKSLPRKYSPRTSIMIGSSNGCGYLAVTLSSKTRTIHTLVAEAFHGTRPSGLVTDHIDNNKLNNESKNLRYITNRENTIRGKLSSLKSVNSSNYVGVSWSKNQSKWVGKIRIDGVRTHLGTFDDEVEASKAYIRARKQLEEPR